MHEHQNSRDVVYIIFRLFNLGKDDMGLRLYVDPAQHEANGSLLFTATEWTVVPGPR